MHRSVATRRQLIVLLALQVGAIALLYGFFVRTAIGHRIEDVAPAWSPGWSMVLPWLDELLHLVAVLGLMASAVVLLVGLIRRGLRLALTAAMVVVGANISSQLMKRILGRPIFERDLRGPGLYPDLSELPSSLPSGHTTAVAALAVIVILVVPTNARYGAAISGAVLAMMTGLATILAGWHRLSDVVAAFLVVGCWFTVGALLAPRRSIPSGGRPVITMWVAGGVLAAGLVTYVLAGHQHDPRSAIGFRRPSAVASLGGAATIAGAALLLVMLPVRIRIDSSHADGDPADR